MTRKTRNKRRRHAQPKPVSVKPAREQAAPANTGAQPPPPAAEGKHAVPAALAALALCLLVAAGYFPATMGGFVWDDVAFTKAGPIQTLAGIREIWFNPLTLKKEGHYWPILYTSFWLEHKLWGFNPVGYHINNLLMHAGVTLLLWRLLLRLNVPGAWFAAAVFAVHPLHAESVAWVIGRKDLLAGLFFLACALTYLRFMEDRRRGRYIAALVLYVSGLLCKSIVVTLPASLLIWHWWKQGRVSGDDLKRVSPFFVLGLAITVADWLYFKGIDPSAFDYSLPQRMLIAAHALWFYAGKLVWPVDLAVIYPRWDVDAWGAAAWGHVVAAVAVVVLLWRYRRRIGTAPLCGVLFFAVTLSPVLGFVDYGFMKFSFVADRYQYLAGIGVIATLTGAAARGLSMLSGAWKISAQAAAAGLLAVFGTLTWQQSGIYRDSLTFYSHIVSVNPKARFAHLIIGREHQNAGRLEEALANYRIEHRLALEQDPPDQYWLSNVHLGLGAIAEAQGRLEEAEAHYKKGITFPEAFNRLTALWMRQERYQEALALYREYIRNNPWGAQLYAGMGVVLVKLNRFDEALQSFDRALSLDPYLQTARIHRNQLLQIMQSRHRQ